MKFNSLIPELSVSDLQQSLDFYTRVLGFKIEYQREESKLAFLSLHGSQLMIQEHNDNWNTGELQYPLGRGINLQMEVDHINPLLVSLADNHYPVFVPKTESWYRAGKTLFGQLEFLVQDPDGYLLRFSESLGEKPA